MCNSVLVIGAHHHHHLKAHLFPGDGLEAAALLICGRAGPSKDRICVEKLILIPHQCCKIRSETRVNWPGEYIDQATDLADAVGATIIAIHSHPSGTFSFSNIDDESDEAMIPCLFHGMNDMSVPHGSAIMVPNGSMRVRLYDHEMNVADVSRVVSVGSDMSDLSEQFRIPMMPYTKDMTSLFNTMTACVVGVSGTGSILSELLARLGIGKLILIDFDKVGLENLNRILNSKLDDAKNQTYKTEMMRDAIAGYQPHTEVVCINSSICRRHAIIAASEADILFSCVDSVEGRFYCDLIASACLVPLIDVGVTIPTRETQFGPAISDVCGRVDYVFPGGSSLGDRKIWTPESLSREYLQRSAPDILAEQIAAGYIKGVPDEAPSVISLNMRAASAAVNELIFRLFPIRHESNDQFASTFFSLTGGDEDHDPESDFTASSSSIYGQGLREPLLGLASMTHNAGIAA